MRFPLMFRTTHDALLAAKDAQLALLRETLAKAEARAEAAEARAVALMDLTKPAPKPTLPPKRVPSATETAIALRASGDPGLARYLGQWAKQQRAGGMSEEAIADAILKGESSDEDGVPE
jgi:hypothetical protein